MLERFKDLIEKTKPDYLVDVREAVEAEMLQKSQMLNAAFEYLEKEYTDAWRLTNVKDVEAREKLYIACGVLDKIKDHLQKVINNGSVARHELEKLNKGK